MWRAPACQQVATFCASASGFKDERRLPLISLSSFDAQSASTAHAHTSTHMHRMMARATACCSSAPPRTSCASTCTTSSTQPGTRTLRKCNIAFRRPSLCLGRTWCATGCMLCCRADMAGWGRQIRRAVSGWLVSWLLAAAGCVTLSGVLGAGPGAVRRF